MAWFAAHIMMLVRFKDGRQDVWPVHENVVLFRGTAEEARAKARRRGLADQGDAAGTYEWMGRPAELVFAGLRKVVACAPDDGDPGEGTEVSYSELLVRSRADLERLASGRPTEVHYEE